MITKFKYLFDAKTVSRAPEYSFTAIEDLGERLQGINNQTVISNITNGTLKGEAERNLIGFEDTWFKIQTAIQSLDTEKATLELKLKNGDKNGNPLTPDVQTVIAARIAECKEGTIVIEKEFYDHYTRETHKVKEVHQTPYTLELEARNDLEATNPYLGGLRGVTTAPTRPVQTLSEVKETIIRKELVRQEINLVVGDEQDLIADMSNALSTLIKQVNGQNVTTEDTDAVTQFVERQTVIAGILNSDYNK